MTNSQLHAKVEWEGVEYLLTEIDPDSLEDPAVAYLLRDAQRAYRELENVLAPEGW